jgi:transcription-repair coupling factor (superfamily II helicase)
VDLDVVDKTARFLNERNNVVLSGLTGSAKSFLFDRLTRKINGRILCLVADEETAYDLAAELKVLNKNGQVRLFLNRDLLFIKENYSQAEVERIQVLHECILHPDRAGMIIATAGAMAYPIISPQEWRLKTIKLNVGQEIDMTEFIHALAANSYKRSSTVTRPGEFALRGGIIDLFPVNEKQPYRIDFWGNMVDDIHTFDVNTQRTDGGRIDLFSVCAADELTGKKINSTLLDYLKPEAKIIFDEPREFFNNCRKHAKHYKKMLAEMKEMSKAVPEILPLDPEFLRGRLNGFPTLYHAFFTGNIPQVKCALAEHIAQKEMESFHNQYEMMFTRIQGWLKQGYRVRLAVKNKTARRQISQELLERGINGSEYTDEVLKRGFISTALKFALITENDIWKNRAAGRKRRKAKISPETRILGEDLKIGDYVVHEQHGVGIFQGISLVENGGVTKEYITIQYAGNDKLYLPVDRLDSLYRFLHTEEKTPRLNKLGGSEWERTKQKAARSIREMAQELLSRYAKRQAQEGYAFAQDTRWQEQFEEDFPYTETPDQMRAINDVKRDMESIRPMERLVCGDVGYGKTEVAMRAAFKALMDGKQIAVLVPTTVLAEQHFQNFKERFSPYAGTVECLSRLKGVARQKKIAAELAKGSIDIIIGTHRLLSKDIVFKDLGLLIIDEEHRFGVAQKEHIKAYKDLVDILSLSATPIPRSLHMSLNGLMDMSVIDTPPPERYPITTYVLEFNAGIICEAILNEINRQGQVFFVHNRIEDIYEVKRELEAWMPEISICLGHGRMREGELTKVIMDFAQGRYQLFLCTTIIESGLDLPNVNTIIVDEADKLGLAQLYQLRGRVGRSERLAYAYLTYRPYRSINETAQKRLAAIREFSDLGSGMKIALRDLEIRGFGNILGSEQHGYINAIGFDLYCHLLEQETAKIKGETSAGKIQPFLDIDVDSFIPDTYIEDAGTKMRIYRRLLLADTLGEIDEIKDEMADRFGVMPKPVENFLNVAALKVLAQDKEVISLRHQGKYIEIKLSKPAPDEMILKKTFPNVKKVRQDLLRLSSGKYTLGELKDLLSAI